MRHLASQPAAVDARPFPPKPILAPGVVHESYWWGRVYRGTPADLIAAGLARPGWFPGEPGQKKTSGGGDLNGVRVRISKTSARRCELYFHYPHEIAQAECARSDERNALARKAAEFEVWRERTTLTGEGYRQWLRGYLAGVRRQFEMSLGAHASCWALTDDARAEVAELCDRVASVIERSPIRFDRAARVRLVEEQRALVARADTGLQLALASACAPSAAALAAEEDSQ